MFCLNFSSTLEDSSTPKGGSDIDIFSNRKWVLTVYTLVKYVNVRATLSKWEKYKHSSPLPNINIIMQYYFWG